MTNQPEKYPPFDRAEHHVWESEFGWGNCMPDDATHTVLTRDEYTELREAWLAQEEYKKFAENIIDDLEEQKGRQQRWLPPKTNPQST